MVLLSSWSDYLLPGVQFGRQRASFQHGRHSAEARVKIFLTSFWIAAGAGMTDQHLSKNSNLDKTKNHYFLKSAGGHD